MSSLESGKTILHYRILEKIGQGGMGEVYKAEDRKLGRPVAIKLLPAGTAQDETARARLVREARSASALNHPNIVTIHSIDEAEDYTFIVMEFVEGQTLAALIQQGALPFPKLLDLSIQVADALASAHSIGLIHRDIKPQNILITSRGQAKILDFGLAKIVRPMLEGAQTQFATLSADLTDAGAISGTVAYMSPEQTRGEALDARTDIFSFGTVLYQAATGKLPFHGPSVLSMMHGIAAIDALRPTAINRDLPREFDLIIERALAKDREKRYFSATELADALRALKGSETVPRAESLADLSFSQQPVEAFVGRERELKRLRERLEQVIDGSGKIVFLTGEPGIGKSTLSAEFLRRARLQTPSLLLGRGRCVEQYGTGEAYLPFLDALSGLLDGPARDRILPLLRSHAPTWCLQLPAAFGSTGMLEQLQRETIGATKERMVREMGDALGALAAASPMVLLLEDLHWADPSTVDLLRHICQRIGEQRLLLLGTFRPEDLETGNHPLKKYKLEMQTHKQGDEIALEVLSEEQIATYLDSKFAPNNFARELAALIAHKTEGHPLFATSLAQFLAERGDIAKTNQHWALTRKLSEMDLETPENIRSMIRKKIEALAEEDRRALQYASVGGEEFLSTVLAKLLGEDELAVEERLDRLAKGHRLIEARGEEDLPDGSLATRYRFSHALYQNLLYDGLVSKRRILLHRQAGEQLLHHYGDQAPRIAAKLALHFERGRDFERAIEYLTHAGDNAAKLFANPEAEEHYSHALSLIERIPAEKQDETSLSIRQKRGAVNMALGRFEQAIKDFTAMLDCARKLKLHQLECGALYALSNVLFFSHKLDEMEARTKEALSAAERAGSATSRLDVMGLIGLKHACYGELDQSERAFSEVIRSATSMGYKPGMLNGMVWMQCIRFFQSEYEEAEKLGVRAAELASELRDAFSVMTCYFFLGLTRANLGRMSEALATLHEGIAVARRNGDLFWFPRLPNCIGWVHRELQDFERALQYDRQGVEIGREHHVLEAEANSLINIGLDQIHAGDSEKTLAAFREVEGIFERDKWFRWRYNLRLQAGACEHWLAAGDLERASEYAQRLLESSTHHKARKWIAVAHKLLAEIAAARGDLAKAEAELNRGIEILRQFPAPLAAWKIYSSLGRLHARAGNTPAALKAFEQAQAIIHSIAANVKEDNLRNTFLDSAAVREVTGFVERNQAGSGVSV